MVLLSPQSLHNGSSLKPHLCKFVGVGSVSYTDITEKRDATTLECYILQSQASSI